MSQNENDLMQRVNNAVDNDRGWYENWRSKVHSWIAARGPGEIADAVLLLPDLMALAIGLLKDPRTPLPFKSQLLVVAAYVLLPVDLIPEAVLGAMGLADDTIILSTVMLSVLDGATKIPADVVRQHWHGSGDVTQALQEIVKNKGELVNTKVWKKVRGLFGDTSPEPAVVEGRTRRKAS